jgi:hypothetical protein
MTSTKQQHPRYNSALRHQTRNSQKIPFVCHESLKTKTGAVEAGQIQSSTHRPPGPPAGRLRLRVTTGTVTTLARNNQTAFKCNLKARPHITVLIGRLVHLSYDSSSTRLYQCCSVSPPPGTALSLWHGSLAARAPQACVRYCMSVQVHGRFEYVLPLVAMRTWDGLA